MTGGIPGVPSNEPLQSFERRLTALMRQEFQAFQHELTNPFLRARAGARLLGGSTVLGSMAAGGATALAIRLLDRRLPATASAAVVTAALGAGASAMAAAGRARMRQPVPAP
jgi:Putative Actinobacterial Holin-X, holin superfamily III